MSDERLPHQGLPAHGSARLRSLRDRAFDLVRKGVHVEKGPAGARSELAGEFPDLAGDANAALLWGVLDQAVALQDRAVQLADLYREGIISKETAVARLEAQFPGFSPPTYEDAFGRGWFYTR